MPHATPLVIYDGSSVSLAKLVELPYRSLRFRGHRTLNNRNIYKQGVSRKRKHCQKNWWRVIGFSLGCSREVKNLCLEVPWCWERFYFRSGLPCSVFVRCAVIRPSINPVLYIGKNPHWLSLLITEDLFFWRHYVEKNQRFTTLCRQSILASGLEPEVNNMGRKILHLSPWQLELVISRGRRHLSTFSFFLWGRQSTP